MVHPQIRREQLSSQKRDFGARAPTSFVAHLVAGLLAVPHDPWAARLSSTKHVARPFLGSILGLPAVAETICSRAEGTVTGAPVLGQRLGRAQHHRVVLPSSFGSRQQIAENSINVHLPLELAWLTVHRPVVTAGRSEPRRQRPSNYSYHRR